MKRRRWLVMFESKSRKGIYTFANFGQFQIQRYNDNGGDG